jgi:hypothetical protein
MAVGGSALLVLIGGSTAGIAALTEDQPGSVGAVGQAAPAQVAGLPATDEAAPAPALVPTTAAGYAFDADTAEAGDAWGAAAVGGAAADADAAEIAVGRRTSDQADRTGTREPRRPVSPDVPPATAQAPVPAAPQPEVTTQTVTETRAIPYRTRLIRDPGMRRGERRVQTPGVAGEKRVRYVVTYTDGQETGRRLVDSVVVRKPQHRVVAVGTRRGQGNLGSVECRTGPCISIGRKASCDEPVEPASPVSPASPAPEVSAVRPGGPVVAADEDDHLLEPSDLDGLELGPALIC